MKLAYPDGDEIMLDDISRDHRMGDHLFPNVSAAVTANVGSGRYPNSRLDGFSHL